MDISTIWWIAFGAMVAAELMTGTFYLLMMGLACAVGALCAHAGLSTTIQLSAAAAAGALLSFGPLPSKMRQALGKGQAFQMGDKGARIVVCGLENGEPSALHRGTCWPVRLAEPDGAPLQSGDALIIERIDGVALVCSRAPSGAGSAKP